MAYDKVIDSEQLNSNLASIANAIREKTGESASLQFPNGFTEAIENYNDPRTKQLIERSIEEFIDDTVSVIGDYSFHECLSLSTVDVPNATKICKSAFSYCENLTYVNCPNVTDIKTYAFAGCTNLTKLESPLYVEKGSQGAFLNCPALTMIDLPVAISIHSECFQGCSSLKTLILRKTDDICALTNIGAFDNSPFSEGGSGGIVYVPQSLISTYQIATNWSSLVATGTCTFLPLEDIPDNI